MERSDQWPPHTQWDRFPNWEYALGEEEPSKQSEGTLRPARDQTLITAGTRWTAGEAQLRDGQVFRCFIELQEERPAGAVVFSSPEDGWSIRVLVNPLRWAALVDDPLRYPAISPADVFLSLRVLRSRLPLAATGVPLQLAVAFMPDSGSAG